MQQAGKSILHKGRFVCQQRQQAHALFGGDRHFAKKNNASGGACDRLVDPVTAVESTSRARRRVCDMAAVAHGKLSDAPARLAMSIAVGHGQVQEHLKMWLHFHYAIGTTFLHLPTTSTIESEALTGAVRIPSLFAYCAATTTNIFTCWIYSLLLHRRGGTSPITPDVTN